MPLITADENSILLVSYSVDDPNTYYVPDSNVNKTVTKNETLDFPEAYLILRTVTIMCTPKFKQLTSLGNSYKVYWANIPESGNVDPKLLGDGDWSEVVDGSVKLMAHKIWVKIGVSGNANYITVDNGDTNQPLTWHSSSGINLSGEWGAYVVDTAVAGLIKFDYTGGIV